MKLNEISTDKLTRMATYCSVGTVTIITIIKIIAWSMTNSVSILASLADSALDLVTSAINLLAVHYALQPPDNEHRFGHNKAEDLAVFMQSSFFGISGILLMITAVKRIFVPEIITPNKIGIIIMVISIILTLMLVTFQKYVINKTKSNVISADHLHYVTDLLSNLAVIVSLLVARFWENSFVDPILACLMAIYILHGAYELLQQAFKNLMDHELADVEKAKISEIIRQHREIKGYHDLKTRYAGTKAFIQFHIELDGEISLSKVHEITTEIEQEILKQFPEAEVIIHPDPDGVDEQISYHA